MSDTLVCASRRLGFLAALGLAAACSSATGPRQALVEGGAPPMMSFEASAPLEYSGRAAPADSASVQITLAVRNPGRDSVRVEHGACSFAVWAYAAGARGGRPAWDNRLPSGSGCILIGLTFVVAPGASRDVPAGRYQVARILGDSLPAGRYYFTIVLKDRRDQLTVVPAGDAPLAR